MDFEKAKLNPAAVFKSPQEVVSSQELAREQKIEILRRWEQDTRLREKSMSGGVFTDTLERGDRAQRSRWAFFNSLLTLALYGGDPCHC